MKKLFAILLALVLSLTSAFISSADTVTVDRPTETKTFEWAIGYAHRCGNYRNKRYYAYMKNRRMQKYTRVKHVARRVALAPLHLMIGVASAEAPVQVIIQDGYEFRMKEWSFKGEDKLKELARRTEENAKASRFLGNPAKASAEVFSEGIMAANKLLCKNAGDFGGKYVFEGINTRKARLDEIKVRLAELGVNKEENKYSERTPEEYNEIRSLQKERKQLKSELRTLNSAVKEMLKENQSEVLALIQAQADAAKTRRRERKSKEAIGRQINMCEKPMLKSYKLMHYDAKQWMKPFTAQLNRVNEKAATCSNLAKDESASDSDKAAAKKALDREFNVLVEQVNAYKASGKKIILDAQFAKIHNARQSQLTDVIGVPYGKTTDMIVSISHNVANALDPDVVKFIGDNITDANEKVQTLMEAMVSIATDNGHIVKTLPVQGVRRELDFVFWNANNSALKLGKYQALNRPAYEIASKVGRAGMTVDEFEEVNCNGSDLLKWWSYATTPGAPLKYKDGPLTVNDVLVLDSVDIERTFANVLQFYDKEKDIKLFGKKKLWEKTKHKRTAFDGMLFFMVPIPSQQIRGGFCFKGFGLCCAYEDGTTIIDEIAKREGLEIPEYIKDVDGVMRRWRDYKVICTKDAWKWAGWKFGTEKRKFTYEEYRTRMNELAKEIPCVNMLYTARVADATEESKRRLTRQATQMFKKADQEDIADLTAKSVRKIQKLSTHEGVIRKMAGLDKPEEERTDFERLVEACPELLNHPYMKRAIEDMFNRQVAEAAVRPEVDGIYPYIGEDPVAFFKIVLWGMNPNTKGLGYLDSRQVNIPNEEEGRQLFIIRYPNNYLCGQLRLNHNDDIYRCCGNVMILSLDGGVLVWADGDTDGDEMCVVRDECVIRMMRDSKKAFNPSMIVFPHDTLEKVIIKGKSKRAAELAHAITVANKYGPEVGRSSNMATKFFHNADVAMHRHARTRSEEDGKKVTENLDNAILAHIAAIIAIDLAKTGKMPEWLETALNKVRSSAGKKMPWNQRFCKDNKSKPWFSKVWNEETLKESDDIVDRIARYVIDTTNAESYKAPTGDEFDVVRDLLCNKTGLLIKGSDGKLDIKQLRALEARNYRTKSTNSEGDDEYRLVQKLRSGDAVGGAEFVRFLWRNQASLIYTLQRAGDDKLDNAMMQNQYLKFCREMLIGFGSNGGNEAFMSKSKDVQEKSNVWKFVNMAFNEKNGIGKNVLDIDEKGDFQDKTEKIFSLKASFALFVVKVFAYDLYQMVCDKKGIEERYTRQSDEAVDDANFDMDYDGSYTIGYCDYNDDFLYDNEC